MIDPLRLVQWATRSVEANPDVAWFHALGLAEYRARHYEAAIDKAQKSNSLNWDPIAKSQNWLVLAMAHHHLGHNDEARQCLDTARKLIDNCAAQEIRRAGGHADGRLDSDPSPIA